jgi:tryptophanase
MKGRPGPDGRETPVGLDLVRLAVPRRVYTCCQLDYVAEAVVEIHAARETLTAFDIVDQPHTLRHFGARLAPRPAAARQPALAR